MDLEKHLRKVKRYWIIPAGPGALYSDLADVTEIVLYEAKGSVDPMSVHLALGQVLDYGRFVDGSQPRRAGRGEFLRSITCMTRRVVGIG